MHSEARPLVSFDCLDELEPRPHVHLPVCSPRVAGLRVLAAEGDAAHGVQLGNLAECPTVRCEPTACKRSVGGVLIIIS